MGHTSRKRKWMFKSRQKSLLGFRGFTVSDYVSTIFINGKALFENFSSTKSVSENIFNVSVT